MKRLILFLSCIFILVFSSLSIARPIEIDNDDQGMQKDSGGYWWSVQNHYGFYTRAIDNHFVYTFNESNDTQKATWTHSDFTGTKRFKVEVHIPNPDAFDPTPSGYPYVSNYVPTTNAKYYVYDAYGQKHYKSINQATQHGWIELCTTDFYNYVKVKLGDGTGESPNHKYCIAYDAVRVTEIIITKPDMIVEDLWTDPSKPTQSYRTKLYAKIKNIGDATASSITLKYYINGSYVGQDTHSSLSPGSTQTEYYSYYNFSAGGNHSYKVVINSVSGETNTSNNDKTTTVSVTELPYITASPTTVYCRSSGEEESSNISSNVSWSASDNSSWISTRSYSSRVNITCQNNSSTSQRSGRVTVSGSGASAYIDVVQEGAPKKLSVSRSSVTLNHSGGNEAIDVSSNISWNVSESLSWLSVVPSSGSNNSFFQINCNSNSSVNERSGTVTVSGSGLSKQIQVTQRGAPAKIELSPTSKNFSHSGGNSSINVTANISWNVNESSSWLSVSKSSNSFSIQCDSNATTSQRSATITVSGSGVSKQVRITQSPAPARLDVSPSTKNFSENGGNATINVNANINWTVSENVNWLAVSKSSNSFSVQCDPNNTINQRSASITVSGGSLSKQVQIIQSPAPARLIINPASINFSNLGGSETIQVDANINWNIVTNSKWLSVNPSSGSNSGHFSVNCSVNSSINKRSGTISVSGGEKSVNIQVTQEAMEAKPMISIEPSVQSVPANAGSTLFDIGNSGTGTLNWVAEVEKGATSWLSISQPVSSSNSGSILVNFERNDHAPRTGQIIVSSTEAENSPVTVEVAQDQFPRGSVSVCISPQEAVDSGAKWSTDGTLWIEHNVLKTLPTGLYSIQYKPITGWQTPPVQNITVTDSETLEITALYSKNDQNGWQAKILASGEKLKGASECDVIIGVADEAVRLETPPSPPPEYSVDLKVYPESLDEEYQTLIYQNNQKAYRWYLGINPHGNLLPLAPRKSTLSWNPTNFSPDGFYQLRNGLDGRIVVNDMRTITSYDVTGPNSVQFFTVTWGFNISVEMDLSAGWHLISIPFIPEDNSLTSLFPDASVAYKFDGRYELADSLEPGLGYWIKLKDGGVYHFSGQDFVNYSKKLESGWHLVGAVNGSARPGPDHCISVIYGFNQSYYPTEIFEAGNGYWIKLTQSTDLKVGVQ